MKKHEFSWEVKVDQQASYTRHQVTKLVGLLVPTVM